MVTFAENRTCLVCGSLISDNNPDGIGCECRYSHDKARGVVFFDDKERAYSFYNIKSQQIVPFFLEVHKNVKFRSQFKKDFFVSISTQWEEKGFVSKKQLSICIDWLYWKDCSYNLDKIDVLTRELQAKLIKEWGPSSEEIVKIVNLANKFRHEYRNK